MTSFFIGKFSPVSAGESTVISFTDCGLLSSDEEDTDEEDDDAATGCSSSVASFHYQHTPMVSIDYSKDPSNSLSISNSYLDQTFLPKENA